MGEDKDAAAPRWEPGRAWAVPVITAAWLWAAGWLPLWAARAGWALPAPLLAAAGLAAGVVLARRSTTWDGTHRAWLGNAALLLSTATGLACAAWLWLAAVTDPWVQTPLLAVGAGTLGLLWWGLVDGLAPRAAYPDPAAPAPPEVAGTPQEQAMRAMLDAAGMGGIRVIEHAENRAGHAWLLGPRTHDEEGQALAALADFADFTAALPRLLQRLAVHWRPAGVTFTEGDIRPEPIAVDRWWLHVATRHVEREVIPASAAPPPRPWTMPAWLGLYLDGTPLDVTLCSRHVKIVGSTEGGKTVVANNLMRAALTAATGGRRECHVWVVATDKLTPFVWPWVEGWLAGRDTEPVLDWIAGESPEQVLRALAAAYRLARSRNQDLDEESKVAVRPDSPGLLIVWEEGMHGGQCTDTIDIDGDEYTISRLVNALLAMSRSAGVSVAAITQQGLYDGLGPYGDQMMRNFRVRVCTVTETDSDGTNTLPKLQGQGVNTMMLRDHTIYVQASLDDDARAMPGKVSHLDGSGLIGATVATVAAVPPPRWTPAELAALGEDYADRWNPHRLPALVRAAARRGWTWPAPAAPAPHGHHGVAGPHAVQDGAQEQGRVAVAVDDGLPTEADLDELDALAARMVAEVDAVAQLETAGSPAGAPLPEPLGSLRAAVAAVAAESPTAVWVATADLCDRVWGTTRPAAVAALGRAIVAGLPGVTATDPRAWAGGRGRGYLLADLRGALDSAARGDPG